MVALFLLPLYLLANYYILKKTICWLKAYNQGKNSKKIINLYKVFYICTASTLIIAPFLKYNKIGRIIKYISSYWLGIFGYILFLILAINIIKNFIKGKIDITSKKSLTITASIFIILIIVINILGISSAFNIQTTKYNININKNGTNFKNFKIVMFSDSHFGNNSSYNHIKQMVNKINQEKPDVVVIAGDIFDNDYNAIKNPNKIINQLKKIKSKYGVYATYGNHDVSEEILVGFTFNHKNQKLIANKKMNQFLKKANITLLNDKSTLINNSIYLYGRPDYEIVGRNKLKRKSAKEITSSMDKSKPIIIIDHEPRQLDELAQAGVDLDLSGHTHNGQTFPTNYLVKIIWKNPYGYLKVKNMHSIVTSGVGVYGTNMRLFTKSEITDINITFQK